MSYSDKIIAGAEISMEAIASLFEEKTGAAILNTSARYSLKSIATPRSLMLRILLQAIKNLPPVHKSGSVEDVM